MPSLYSLRQGSPLCRHKNKAIIRRLVEEVYNGDDLDVLEELLTPEFVNHSAVPEHKHGIEGFKHVNRWVRAGFSDAHYEIEDMIAEGDKVATRYTLEGTHEGELFGVPPTGQRLSIKSISVERVSDGKIREHWRITDTLDMMQQLAVIPMPQHA